jgi:hypothetical protein
MSSSSLYSLVLRVTFLCVVTISFALVTRAQTVVYDWSSDSKVPESYPTINRKQNVTFRITNVNDILFSYRLQVTQQPKDADDFKYIAGLLQSFIPKGSATGASGCTGLSGELQDAVKTAIEAIDQDPFLPVGYAASQSNASVPLSQSVSAWRSHRSLIVTADQLFEKYEQCPADEIDVRLRQDFINFRTRAQAIEDSVNGDHVFMGTHELSPGYDISVSVFEVYKGKTVSSKTFTFPGTDVLTLSAGALFSRLPDQTYESRKTPASTLNVLTVEGNSRATPSLVALLNYSLGALRLDGDTTGLALSAGPVIKIGGKSDASSFGFFTGISWHLHHRIYFTPGVHFGQFSDFPVGFGNGSTIPANFGELSPVKRWTAKFGLAITFKTKDFSGLVPSDTPKVTGDEGAPASNPSSSPEASPSPEASTSPQTNATQRLVLPFAVARDFLKLPTYRPIVERSSSTTRTEPVRRASVETPEPATVSDDSAAAPMVPVMVTSESRAAIIQITSLATSNTPNQDRVTIRTTSRIQHYSMYFRNGRFYLVIPNAKLEVLQDGLTGRLFNQAVIERRGDDLILSLAMVPGVKASVKEGLSGLDLILASTASN